MNQELEDAYNEWLITFGYRPVDIADMTEKDYLLCGLMHAYKRSDLLKRETHHQKPERVYITYQLKTIEEIKINTK